jgi:hypothetical protein
MCVCVFYHTCVGCRRLFVVVLFVGAVLVGIVDGMHVLRIFALLCEYVSYLTVVLMMMLMLLVLLLLLLLVVVLECC